MPEGESPQTFRKFGGLRLDIPSDEVGADEAIFLSDVDLVASEGRLISRYGFRKLSSAEASGEYMGLFPHSPFRLLATKKISPGSKKIVAIDSTGAEHVEAAWTKFTGRPCFAHYGTPSGSYTYARQGEVPSHAVVRFDGTSFSEPTATVDGAAEKQFPRGNFMIAWPQGGNRLVTANTASTGGPGEAPSSASHVWFSEAGTAEEYESTAYVRLSAGDGEQITGMCVWGGQVFVFLETKFFVFFGISEEAETGKPEFNFREVTLGAGNRIRRDDG